LIYKRNLVAHAHTGLTGREKTWWSSCTPETITNMTCKLT